MEEKNLFEVEEAIEAVKSSKKEKFDSTIELHIRLGVDPQKGEAVRGNVSLLYTFSKPKKILAFTSDPSMSLGAGASQAGGQEMIKEIKESGKCDFDVVISEPGFMKELSAISKILGPKGLMPSPKNETVTANPVKTISQILKGRIAFKNDDGGNIHVPIGKSSFPTEHLEQNFKQVLDAVKRAKPQGFKGIYIRSARLCSTMGNAVRVKVF